MNKNLSYIIVTPSYVPNSGGIIALHKLCHDLNQMGERAYLYHLNIDKKNYFETNQNYQTPIADENTIRGNSIILYPEIVKGNPLNGKNIVRWLLNRPGEIGGDGYFEKNDLIYHYSSIHLPKDEKNFNKDKTNNFLSTHDINFEIFRDYGNQRKGSCFLIHKGNKALLDNSLHPGAIELTDNTPSEKMAKLFNSVEYFYSYDSATFISVLAALCGAKSIIIPDGTRTIEQLIKAKPYGIAHGVSDLKRAIDSLHLLKPWLEEKLNIDKKRIENFVIKTQDIFKKKEKKIIKINDDQLTSIIVLSYNTLYYTRKTIESIVLHTSEPYEIIIVDNASTDGSVKYLNFIQSKYDNIKAVFNDKNIGFSAANNQAAKYAKGKYLMVLNSDVIVPRGWLSNLINSLNSDSKIGAVGTLSNSISGRQQIDTTYSNEDEFIEFAKTIMKKNKGRVLPRRRLAGFAILIEKKLYDEIEGFDESYKLGNFEDDDFSLKITNKGYSLMVDESLIIHHYGSQSFKLNNIDYSESLKQNERIFKSKWPDIKYNELLEIDNSLLDWELSKINEAFELFKEERYSKSTDLVDEILNISPLSIEAFYLKSLLLCQNESYAKSLVYLEKIISLGRPDASVYSQRGIVFLGLKSLDEAISSFQKSIELDPLNIDYYKLRSESFIMNNDIDSAIDSITETLNIFPEDVDSQKRLKSILKTD